MTARVTPTIHDAAPRATSRVTDQTHMGQELPLPSWRKREFSFSGVGKVKGAIIAIIVVRHPLNAFVVDL